MIGYRLTWKGSAVLTDASLLRPDVLCSLAPDALAEFLVPTGRTRRPLGELFDIQGQPGPALHLHDTPPWSGLGAGMTAGELTVHGHAGDDLGAAMTGGTIRVLGDVGHRAGGPGRRPRGMAGGQIIIHGRAGDHVGFAMRRGLIVVTAAAGRSPGYRMGAGTVVVGQGPLDHPGLQMRRGTVVGLDPAGADVPIAGHLTHDATLAAESFIAWRLLLTRLARWEVSTPDPAVGQVRLLAGDRFEMHRGEIWQWMG